MIRSVFFVIVLKTTAPTAGVSLAVHKRRRKESKDPSGNNGAESGPDNDEIYEKRDATDYEVKDAFLETRSS